MQHAFSLSLNLSLIFLRCNWNAAAKDNGENTAEGDNDANITETKANGSIGDEDSTNVPVLEGEVVNEQELKYWKAVKENPADFTSWTYLLQFVEQEVCNKPNLSVVR